MYWDIAPYGSLIFSTCIPLVGKPPGDRDAYQWKEHLPSMGEALDLLLELLKTNKKQNKELHLYHVPGRSSGHFRTAVTPWI